MKKAVGYLLFTILLCFSNFSQAEGWHQISQGLKYDKIIFSDSLLGWGVSRIVDSNSWYTFYNDCVFKTANGGQAWGVCRDFTGDDNFQYYSDLVWKDTKLYFTYDLSPFDGNGVTPYIEFSNDFGNTWQAYPGSYLFGESWLKLSVVDSLNIWATDKIVWKWNDDTGAWDSIGCLGLDPFIQWMPKSIFFCDTLNGFIAGYAANTNILYKTLDGGYSWDSVSILDSLSDFICRTPTNVWAACGSKIKFSSDTGKTWQEQNTGIANSINCIFALNDSVLWAGTNNGLVIHTKNGGINWVKDSLNTSRSVNSIFFTGDSFGWAATADSVLWGFGRAGLGVEGNSPEPIATKGKIFLQASPNPFRQKTTISFEQNSTDPATISIYSIMGQLVKTLVDGGKMPGKNHISWNGQDDSHQAVSQGVYICQMKSANHLATKKIVLLR